MKRFGIRNMGNTCYMNSVIQSLISLEKLREILVSLENTEGVCKNIITLINLPLSKKEIGDVIVPKTLYNSLAEYSDFFKSKVQQDSHECFLIFLDILEKGACKKLDIFYGHFDVNLKCKCGYTRVKTEEFSSLCFPGFFNTEILRDYNCEKCTSLGETTRSYTLTTAPEILCLYINRFGIIKKNASKYSIKEQVYGIYKLKSIILHSGDYTSSGHYYCISKRDDEWYCFNDSVVSKIDIHNIKKEDVYILFYSK